MGREMGVLRGANWVCSDGGLGVAWRGVQYGGVARCV